MGLHGPRCSPLPRLFLNHCGPHHGLSFAASPLAQQPSVSSHPGMLDKSFPGPHLPPSSQGPLFPRVAQTGKHGGADHGLDSVQVPTNWLWRAERKGKADSSFQACVTHPAVLGSSGASRRGGIPGCMSQISQVVGRWAPQQHPSVPPPFVHFIKWVLHLLITGPLHRLSVCLNAPFPTFFSKLTPTLPLDPDLSVTFLRMPFLALGLLTCLPAFPYKNCDSVLVKAITTGYWGFPRWH